MENRRFATPQSIDYLMTLREQRGLPFKDFSLASPEEVDKEIKLVKSYHPASPLQIKTIKEVTARLNNMGMFIRPLDDDDFTSLTGGKDGTAFEYIEYLINKENEAKMEMPLTQEQADYIGQMISCPDITWQNHNIDDRIKFPDGTFKFMNKEEFDKELKNKLTKKEAYEFIEKYRKPFNAWKNTRIRPNQENAIRRYDKYLSSLEYRRERILADGINADQQASRSLRTVYDPIAHIPLDEDKLKQLSKEQASVYMQQLKYAIQSKRLYIYEKERNKDDDFEKLRNVDNTNEWATRELRTLHSMIYSLQKESGVFNEQMTHLIPYQDIYTKASKDDSFFTDKRKHDLIIDYMYYIVANHAITFNDLRIKCQRSSTALKLLEATKSRLLNDRRFMETLLYKN